MALRAGSYDANCNPDWRGIIRQDGAPWYHCMHRNHPDPQSARHCARLALPVLRERDHRNPDAPMPDGWTVFRRGSS